MIGITMKELKYKLVNSHEIEFSYMDCEYSIEAETINGIKKVKIWKCSKEEPICIAETVVKTIEDFNNLFNVRCFNGKSFYEIESEVIVDNVF